MRALHVFPLFGKDLFNGSEYYEYMLSRNLVRMGVQVEVCTTRSRQIRPASAFSLRWEDDCERTVEQTDGIAIRRFSAGFSLPANIGHLVSGLILKRWQREQKHREGRIEGAAELVEAYQLRATSRPVLYDYLAMLARGPHSAGLTGWLVKNLHRYDVVLAGFVPFALIWYLTGIARFCNKPLVLLPLFHPNDIYHHFQLFYRCFGAADAVLTQTPYSTALFERLFPRCRPVQVGVGIDQRDFEDADISGARFRAKHKLEGKRIILFVGRKERHKRYDLAVQAVDMIGDGQVVLVMIGSDVDRAPVGSAHVLHLGTTTRQDLLDAYDACDVFVLPSEHESFGIVFLEAWMRKKPVIGNACCKPVASVIENGVDGFLCESAEEIAAASKRLLSDHGLGKRLGEAGYKKTLHNYTWDVVAAKVLGLYRELCSRDGVSRSFGQGGFTVDSE